LPKTRLYQTPGILQLPHIFSLLRFEQKKNSTIKTKKTNQFKDGKTYVSQQQIFYRLSFRQNYRNQLILTTNFKFKYLIQDLIYQYFAISVCAKIF
jgi:hypothetical protein